jgi:uridine kinase
MIIGICGGSGSGKTTLLRRISDQFGKLNPTVFSMDNYYRPITEQLVDEAGKVNFDLPGALDKTRLFEDLKALKEGKSIEVKEYHFNAPPDKNVLITLEPSELIIIEGLFLFEYVEVKDLLDYSIFMHVDLDVQLDRRLYRDQETRGYSHADIMYQWNNHVLPCYRKFLLPYVNEADFLFNNDHQADQEFERLLHELTPILGCLETSDLN